MKMLADNFLNLSSGSMVMFVRTTIDQNRITLLVAVLSQGFTNAHNANGNLQIPPKLRCSAPNFAYGTDCWSFII
jgi:hypothetical protein